VRRAYPIAIAIVKSFELYNVWVPDDAHDLKLTVLTRGSVSILSAGGVGGGEGERFGSMFSRKTNLESLVLQDTLDGCIFAARG